MASCPNCGFDLSPSGSCPVCGYGSSEKGGSSSASGRRRGKAAAENQVKSSKLEGRGGSQAAALSAENASNPPKARAPFFRRERFPWLLGGAVLVLFVVIGAIVVRGAESSAVQQSAAVQPMPTPSGAQPQASPVPDASSNASSNAASPDSNSSAAAGASNTTPSTAAAKVAQAAGNAPVASGNASSVSGSAASNIQAIYAQDYSVPVGASPINVRATHPIDLYNPSVQPVYNIDQLQEPPLTSEQAYVAWMAGHTNQSASFLRERWQRAAKALERHLVIHRRVLMAFLLTPREWFVRPYNLSRTYENTALPIGYGQTISGPDLVMHMTDALDPQPDQRVLEIGTGSGYQSGVLSQLSNYVYTIEIVKPLAEQTNQIYLDHTKAMPELGNIHRRLADGYYGWPEYAPFDRIIVTTGIDHIPPILLQELKPGGIMVIPIGPPTGQTILKITKTVDKNGVVHLTRTDIYPGVTQIFVPFTASGGGTHNVPSSGR